MLPNDPVFRLMNYDVRVFVKRYYHLRAFFKIFALALLTGRPCQATMGVPPPGLIPMKSIPCVSGPFLASQMRKSDLLFLVSEIWPSSKMCYIVILAQKFQVYPPFFRLFEASCSSVYLPDNTWSPFHLTIFFHK